VTLDVLDLYSGVGGWVEGLRLADQPGQAVGVDLAGLACTVSRAAGHEVREGDIRRLDLYTFEVDNGRPRRIVASPPCQGLSIAGSGDGRRDFEKICHLVDVFAAGEQPTPAAWADLRSELTAEPMRWITAFVPESVAFEQVPTVLPIWEYYAKRLDGMGYSTWAGTLYADDYGVPQRRKRAVMIASKVHEVGKPESTQTVSMRDALTAAGVMPELCDGRFPRLRSNFSGGGPGRTAVDRGRTMRTLDEASVTISGKFPQWCYCTEERDCNALRETGASTGRTRLFKDAPHYRVTVQQGGVLQSFHPDFPWGADAHQQIGNAIPPKLAAAVLRVIP